MLLGCIADDFTGASDLANTLAKGGMTTTQFSGIPQTAAAPDCEAGVVALKTRSIPAGEAVRQSLQALQWLREQGCRQFFFKYCSTFDSTPHGNIGPVAEALLDATDAGSAIVCPAFPATGRVLCLGHLFVDGRLLSESGMAHHPLNPMTDPDIVRWLGRQTVLGVGQVPYSVVRQGPEAVAKAMQAEAEAGRPLIVADALSDADLYVLGQAIAGQRLVTGGSGIALGLPANFRQAGLLADRQADVAPLDGPSAVLSGSCSEASNGQIQHHLASHPGLFLDSDALMRGEISPEQACGFVLAHLGQQPAVYSTAPPSQVAAAQSRYGRDALAARIEHFFGALAKRLVEAGVRRLAIGGGETSGAVVTALGLQALRVGREIDPGVPILASEHPTALRLALKSGNFGSTDFYEKALRAMSS
ncbi:3-oxo-tetronate kinase [Castellaniella sp.]|uniref:3-oxo-tetronate kinase n=1 Tax=Castellaniella sp. TaxID=1955812 RepID=UPI00356A60F5